MNILMISMPVPEENDNVGMHIMPPMALYLLASILKREGHNIKIIDPIVIRNYKPYKLNVQLRDFLKKELEGIDVVGISSNTLNWPTNKWLTSLIREIKKEIIIVLGGLHPSYFYKYIMETNDIDYIIRDEGEVSFLMLVNGLEEGTNITSIPGLVYKSNGNILTNEPEKLTKEQLQQVPIPLYDLLPYKAYSMLPIMTSKGCKYGCQFCSIPRKHNWIGFDTDWVINNTKTIIDNYLMKFKTNGVYFTDDCFTADADRACIILNEILKIDINLTIEARAKDLSNMKLLSCLQNDKIFRIAIGVECGYNEGLKRVNKGLTIEELDNILQLLKKYDLADKAWLSFIYGFPWETLNDCITTIDYAASIVKKYGVKVNINCLSLFPSKIWDDRKIYNIEVDESIFDDNNLIDKDAFFKTHPNFSYSEINYITKYILNYENQNIILRNK